MKRKYLLSVTPQRPQGDRREFTVGVDGDLVIIWRFENGNMTGLYAIHTATGEHEMMDENGVWHQSKLDALLGNELFGAYYLTGSEQIRYSGAVRQAEDLFAKNTVYNWGTLERRIDHLERTYGMEKKDRREQNRLKKIDGLMCSVPELPGNFTDWLLGMSGLDRYYLLADGDGKLYCSHCGRENEQTGLVSGRKTVCMHCKKELIVDRRRKNGTEKDVHAALLQNINAKISVARFFDVTVFHKKKRTVQISESERLILYRDDPKYLSRVFYAQQPRGMARPDFDDRRNPYNRQVFPCYLYPDGIRETLEGTAYETGIRAMETLAAGGVKLHYGKTLNAILDERMGNILEYLQKGRFYTMVREVTDACPYWRDTRGEHRLLGLYLDGEGPEEIFGLGKQGINRLREHDGGNTALEWLRWSEKNGKKLSDEVLGWIVRNKLGVNAGICEVMSPAQVMHYISRQQKESYQGKTVQRILEQWDDYMSMCRKLDKDLTDEMVYRPRELKRRHDECVEALRKKQAVIDMQNNSEAGKARAKKLREDYPNAEAILEEIRPKYEYGNGQYIVLVPKNLVEITLEGYALHHCVASSDRYFERIERRETYICFLRRKQEPETPFYTIEIEPGGTIRQHRSYFDEEPGIEEIRGFLREWQQVVKKRLNEEDRKLARESKRMREENIADLKQKNNTRVLMGLMEDFMEAV